MSGVYYNIQFLYVLIYLFLLDFSNSEKDILHALSIILFLLSSSCISNRSDFMFGMLSGFGAYSFVRNVSFK